MKTVEIRDKIYDCCVEYAAGLGRSTEQIINDILANSLNVQEQSWSRESDIAGTVEKTGKNS